MTGSRGVPSRRRPAHEEVPEWRFPLYSVPRAMIGHATGRRLAGDWRGACAAAGVEVRLDPDRARADHGGEFADALLDDLHHLVPDLVRWHFPRSHFSPDRGALRSLSVVTLSRPGAGPRLAVLGPDWPQEEPPYLVLDLIGEERTVPVPGASFGGHHPWEDRRHLWDSRRVHETRGRWGGSADRAPLLEPDGTPRAAEDLPAADPGPGADPATRTEWLHVLGREPGDRAAAVAAGDPWRVPRDLAAVLAGVSPDHLHPLVRAALAPARPVDGPVGPPPWEPPPPVRVDCGGREHGVALRGGRMSGPHTEQEHLRERSLRALGGGEGGCFAVSEAWRLRRGLPPELEAHRAELFERVRHGDTETVLRYLAAGGDPHVRGEEGETLMHRLLLVDHAVVLPPLLAAGADVDAVAPGGATPLYLAVLYRGDIALVRALLAAGARHERIGDRRNGFGPLADFVRERLAAAWHPERSTFRDAGPWTDLLRELEEPSGGAP
ncbi:hypothetical protein [Nocardiopsis flavescens]